ncbi:MAG: cob(I)yrinic acid a,c-diamide adenosyltransferase [Phycisphaerales bacterium]
MVKLTKIYTRTGDDGTTGLGDASRALKTDIRVEAYGTVDEANAALGLAIVQADASAAGIADLLKSIQHDLFDVGADLCCPVGPDEPTGSRLRIVASQTKRLEGAIDQYNEKLGALNSFILPGGSALSAALHLARTITRRAERLTVALVREHAETTNPETVRYLNRLSDLLFVLCRVANNNGASDVLWVPGTNR